jgi:hypothetical protein
MRPSRTMCTWKDERPTAGLAYGRAVYSQLMCYHVPRFGTSTACDCTRQKPALFSSSHSFAPAAATPAALASPSRGRSGSQDVIMGIFGHLPGTGAGNAAETTQSPSGGFPLRRAPSTPSSPCSPCAPPGLLARLA